MIRPILLIFALLLCLSCSCAVSSSFAQNSPLEDAPSLVFVDAHTHLNSLAMQLQLINEYNLQKVIAFWGRESNNETLIEATKAHPHHLIPFVSISLERRQYREYWESGDLTLIEILEDYLKTGIFKGIGEISITHFPSRGFPEADFSPLGPMMKGIMGLAERTDRA